MKFFMEINTLSHLHKRMQRNPIKPDREAFGGNNMQAKRRTGGISKDRVATDLRAATKREMKFEPLAVHIRWLESCDSFHEIVYRL
jgi:hypothetical protein